MRILTVNAGSSSLKLRVVAGQGIEAAEDLPAETDETTLARAIEKVGAADATAHRFVHGGSRFQASVAIDTEVERGLRELADLAPLHQATALTALAITRTAFPDIPAVACFDTAFHATLPAAAATYAVPREWGIRRYGFHGLSHAYASRRAAELLERPLDELRIVVCHLGAGASLCAVQGGRSVDTTMGFTPLEGLVMATRSGSIDPGAVLWLLEHRGMTPAQLGHALEHESGLLALAGSADMQDVLARADEGDADAILARDVYLHRLRAGIGAMTAALDGLDVLVFTGGVGENAPAIRDAATAGLEVETLVIPAGEEFEMARDAERVLG